MPDILELLGHPFTWGLLLGLVLSYFVWRGQVMKSRILRGELKKLREEVRATHQHLDRHMNLSGGDVSKLEAESLRLKEDNTALKNEILESRGKAIGQERRSLLIYDNAARKLSETAPGFASAWESTFREASSEIAPVESSGVVTGFMKRLVGPSKPRVPFLRSSDPADSQKEN